MPILLQASNDEIDKVDVASRRDAFCGKFSVANNFYQYGVPFTDTTSHTCDVDGAEFAADLDRFVRVCRVVRGLKHARIGSIGARTGAFQTMRFSEKLLQASGLTVVTVDLSEIIFAANAISDDAPEVKAKLDEIAAYGRIPAHIKRENIIKQAKWTIAVDRWIEDNDCDASAIQCWRSLQDNFGCATCLTMSMMGEKLIPSACEVDVMGAISMYALALAADAPSAILDWNNNYGREADKCVCTHCGNYPKSFIGETPEICELDVLGSVLGKEKCFGAVKGKVKAGPDDLLPRLDRRPARRRQDLCRRGRVHRRSVRDGWRHRRDQGDAAATAARLHRPQRLRASRGDGARPSRRGGQRGRLPLSRTGRPTATTPSRQRCFRFFSLQDVRQ